MKSITVVAGKSLRKQAINLVHTLSKQDNIQAAYWTPKQLKDNEVKLSGSQAVILIGNSPEADPYIDLVKRKFRKHGVSWGYDGSKAAISIESSQVDREALAKDLKKLVDEAKEGEKESKQGASVSIGTMASFGVLGAANLPLLFFFPLWGSLTILIVELLQKKKKLRESQYTYGLMSFSMDKLDDYLEQL